MQNRKTSTIKNFIMNVVLTMSSFIFPLITFPYISRILLAEGTGKVSFATSVISYFVLFAQLGIPTYGIRACAKVRDNEKELSKTLKEIFIINVVTTIITYIVFFLFLNFVPKFREDKELMLITSLTILFNTLGMNWLFQGLEMYTYITIRSLVFKIISIIAMFMLIKSKNDYVIYGAISVFASSASNLLNFFYVPKIVNLKIKTQIEPGKHLKPIFIFFAMTCATSIYLNLDTVMLGFMKTNVNVGYYSAAVKIKNCLVSVVTSLGAVLLPRASYYVEQKSMLKFEEIARKALQFVIFVSIPAIMYFGVYAEDCIVLLSGNEFIPAVTPMRIMLPTLLFIGLTNIMGIQVLVSLGQERKVLYSTICGAIVDFLINLALIPQLGVSGAAIGTVVAEFIVFLVQFALDKELFKKIFCGLHAGKIIVSSVLATLSCVVYFKFELGEFVRLFLSIATFGITYLCGLILLKDKFVREILHIFCNKVNRRRAKND